MPCARVCNESAVPIGIPHCPHCPCLNPKELIFSEAYREVWEEWDLRILILYILFTQIYLHVFGRRRRKSTPRMLNRLNVWLLYLFAEFLATIALGKLSDLKPPVGLLRGLWAPIILFYLGGPDTITVLHLEENHMWTRHLIGLFTQGVRTSYVLLVTSSESCFSVLAMLMLFSGLIKYGERVWVIRSRVVRGKSEVGLIWFDESKLLTSEKKKYTSTSINYVLPDNANLVVKAYSYFQILKPHLPFRDCDRSKMGELIKRFREELVGNRLIPEESSAANKINNAFELIEIELGFAYDVLFSKVETIFTVWGCILRFVSFSCVVSVLVGFLLLKKPLRQLLVDDDPSNPNTLRPDIFHGDVRITIILLCGAIFLEIAGVFVQLVSDWAVVWACNQYPSKLVTPIFRLHKLVASKTKRWSEKMSQINLLNICRNTKLEELEEALYRREKMMKFSSLTPIPSRLQELIVGQLLETTSLPPADDDSSLISSQVVDTTTLVQNSTNMTRGVWTLEKYEFLRFFIIDLEFQESIVVWHIATDICYHLHDKKPVTDEMKETKILSDYMMHLLFTCRLPIYSASNKYMHTCVDVKKILPESIKSPTEACTRLLRESTECDSSNVTVNNIQKLVRSLMDNVENKWKIINDVWVEMLCYAASCCPATNHIDELRHGGEFLTHVWLLLMHFGVTSKKQFGVTKKLGKNARQNSEEEKNEKRDAANILTECLEGLCV